MENLLLGSYFITMFALLYVKELLKAVDVEMFLVWLIIPKLLSRFFDTKVFYKFQVPQVPGWSGRTY